MEELQPNPDDCAKFEPNAFKQEKCKHCARPWTEHKGVISEEYLQKFQQKKLQAQEEKEKKEAEAQQAAAAKKLAKKRASQAADDDWLREAHDQGQVSDSDDDLGFRMLTGDDVQFQDLLVDGPKPNKELKVVNLIDWGECDVADEEAPQGEATGSSVSTRAPPEVRDVGRGDASDSASHLGALPSLSMGNQDLLAEIQLLRQMLADANEEKTIQVAIIRDEVVEKQEQIMELTRQKTDIEALLREARSKLDSLDEEKERMENVDSPEAEGLRARVAELEAQLKETAGAGLPDPAEVERLGARVADLESQLKEAAEGGRADPAEVEPLRARVAELEAQLKETAGAGLPDPAEVERLGARVADLESQLKEAAEGGRTDPAEVEPLRARVAELEAQLKETAGAGLPDPAEVERLGARVADLESQLKEALEAKMDPAEAERLSARAAELEAKLEAAEAQLGPGASPEALSAVAEVRELCDQTCRVLGEGGEPELVGVRTLQEGLELCRQRAHRAVAAAERVCSEKGQLASKLEEERRRASPQDAQAAKALRDIRLHAEQQLAWVLQRMSVSHHQDLQKVGT